MWSQYKDTKIELRSLQFMSMGAPFRERNANEPARSKSVAHSESAINNHLTSVYTFSTLFCIQIPRCWQEEFETMTLSSQELLLIISFILMTLMLDSGLIL